MTENNEMMVYTVKDIQKILGISKNTAYDFLKESPFPVKEIRNQYRIPKAGFDQWLHEPNSPLKAT